MIEVRVVAPFASSPHLDRTVLQLLAQIDAEYVPRLSERRDTLDPRRVAGQPSLQRYLAAMRGESWLVAEREERVVGLMSFIRRHDDPDLARCSPSLYATTVLVPHDLRGTGIASLLYDRLDRVAEQDGLSWITTRTWTTNSSQLERLTRRGFVTVREVADDRGPGLGSVYLTKQIAPGLG